MGRFGGGASPPGFMLQLLLVVLSVAALTSTAQAAKAQLVPDFYKSSCPRAETLISSAVNSALNRQPGAAAGILRMFFHDCFVHGCDASVLIDAPGSERSYPANTGLHGFDVIDAAKAAVEKHCPGVVSCADILAVATQLSVKKLSGGRITYKVPLGRRDGRVSSQADVNGKLPRETASVADLKTMFAANGLSTEDMVALSGAHSVGTTGCDKIQNRLTANPPDATLDASYAAVLKKQCPPGAGTGGRHECHWEWECQEKANARVNLDLATPNRLDEVYYKNLQANKGLLTSDQNLLTSDQNLQTDAETRPMVAANTAFERFGPNFARAMVKMGNIVHLSGTEGEIRLSCSRFN